jgi:hypothetical protein
LVRRLVSLERVAEDGLRRPWERIVPRAAKYWLYVRECEDWAAKVGDEQDRKIFYDMAKDWVELALKEHSTFKVGATTGR